MQTSALLILVRMEALVLMDMDLFSANAHQGGKVVKWLVFYNQIPWKVFCICEFTFYTCPFFIRRDM